MRRTSDLPIPETWISQSHQFIYYPQTTQGPRQTIGLVTGYSWVGLLTANQCREPQYLSSLRIVALTVLCRILNFTGHWPYCAIAIYWLSASIEADRNSIVPSFRIPPSNATRTLSLRSSWVTYFVAFPALSLYLASVSIPLGYLRHLFLWSWYLIS